MIGTVYNIMAFLSWNIILMCSMFYLPYFIVNKITYGKTCNVRTTCQGRTNFVDFINVNSVSEPVMRGHLSSKDKF